MGVIRVQQPGMFTTVQDLGREGFGPLGVSPSGAADPIALRLGNALVGNPGNTAALEMTLLGGTFQFEEPAVVALAGSDFGPPVWTSFELAAGETLRVGPTRSGARCYLCVAGGIEVTPFLGSASTHMLSGLGGLDGRALKKGDVLRTGPAPGSFRKRTVAPAALEALAPRKILRVTKGPQSERFSEAARAAFYECTYRVTEESNRMGLRLEGTPVDGHVSGHMISEGVSLGAIQVPAGGQPIILFVEQQTAGGYPKVANIITADLPSVGQLRPRDEIRFELVDMETARSLLRRQEEILASKELILE